MEEGADLPRRGTRTKGDAVSGKDYVRQRLEEYAAMKAQRIRDAEAAVIAAAEVQSDAWVAFLRKGGHFKPASSVPFVHWENACRKTEVAARVLRQARK